MSRQVIHIHAAAPAHPGRGRACNGCGVCCAAEPCPVARWALWQFRGACRALRWDEVAGRYFCGLVAAPREWWPWLPSALEPVARRFFAARISAGSGCDADFVEEPAGDEAQT